MTSLEEGTYQELCAIWQKAFRQAPPAAARSFQLRSYLLTAMTRLRLDFEVMMLRGKAVNGETVR
jgi:hypothetical protein